MEKFLETRYSRVPCTWCDRPIVDCPSGWAQHCSAAYCLSRRYYKQGYGNWAWCESMAQQNEAHERAAWDAWLRGQQAPPEPAGPPPRLKSITRSRSRRDRRNERKEEERSCRRSRTAQRRRHRKSVDRSDGAGAPRRREMRSRTPEERSRRRRRSRQVLDPPLKSRSQEAEEERTT